MIQTKVLLVAFKGINLLIEQKDIKRPSGRDSIKVKMNSKQVNAKPSRRLCVTVIKVILRSYPLFIIIGNN